MTAVAAPVAFGPTPHSADPPQMRAPRRPLKIRVGSVARPPPVPPDFEDRAWARLQAAVRAIHRKEPLPGSCSQEELHQLVREVCLNRLDARIAQRLHGECAKHVEEMLSALAAKARLGSGREILFEVQRTWQEFCDGMRILCGIFAYLDRTYIVSQRGGPSWSEVLSSKSGGSLWDCGVGLFRSCLDAEPQLREVILQGILDLIDEERRNTVHAGLVEGRPSAGELELLKSLVAMSRTVDLYSSSLESAVVMRTARFYEREAEELLPKLPLAEYLIHCEQRMNQEQHRCETVLERGSQDTVLRAVTEELLQKPGQELLDTGFADLIREHRVQDLARLYRLFEQVDGLQFVKVVWAQATKQCGDEIMAKAANPEGAKTVIVALFDLRERLLEVHQKSFQSAFDLGTAMKDSFESFVNSAAHNLPAKLLARYVDDFMRKEIPASASDDEIDRTLERIIGIFRFIAAKDAFEAFYKQDLAKRLLQQTSTSADSEARMVQMLREECGAAYTSKIEGMFRDVDLSKELLSSFREQSDAQQAGTAQAAVDGTFEFGVSVVATGLWPTQPVSTEIACPLAAKKLQDSFASFYSSRFAGRSLRWSPLLGQCTLRATFDGGVRKELVVSIYQAVICLEFNGAAKLTCAELANRTLIPKADLRRTLRSLALHKSIKVLFKQSKTKEVDDEDVFVVNREFNHKLYRVVMPQISPKEQHEEEAGVEKKVVEDRQHEVDALVVRIMKAKKHATHADLIAEVFKAVRFPASAQDVKARIESLIEREYLERCPGQVPSYNYLA